MTEGIIIGLLSLLGTLAGTYFANRKRSALIGLKTRSTNTITLLKEHTNWKKIKR